MTDKKRPILAVRIAKVLSVAITVSFGISFGFTTAEYYIESNGADSTAVDTFIVTHIDTVEVPRTITFYDTVAVPQLHIMYDTLSVSLPLEPPPPRPWGTAGRP